ncbi:MAG: glycine betaine ABC transporter substrate-binding protein [Myxococcales bacterium]
MILALLAVMQIGSKAFTESVIVAETAAQLARSAGVATAHRRELGGSRILWDALLRGEIDAYPEYTGTIAQELLPGRGDLRERVAAKGVVMSRSLGFSDSYAIGMRRAVAERLRIRTLDDLARHPELRLGLSNEFMDRKDGWPALRGAYGLPQRNVRGLEHDVAVRALASGAIDATDLYTTDAEIAAYDLLVLEDVRRFFPDYEAVLLWRKDLPEGAAAALRRLEGRISAREMIEMNARVKLRREPDAVVAADFLARDLGVRATAAVESRARRIGARTLEHLELVGISLAVAVVVAVPLGIVAARTPRGGQVLLGAVGLVQTIPSLAILVFMIPLLGIGARPAIAALFLYSLLPIVRNTAAGLSGIPPEIRDSAQALGLPRLARLRLIELPIASPNILAGIQTAAVIDVGTATLGALIGAGGYGQPILTGIRLADLGLILEGAVPAAVLALLAQALFELLGRAFVPRGLRL